MNNADNKKVSKEIMKKIVESNNAIPQKAKFDLKLIIENEDDPKRLIVECLLYKEKYKP